MSDTVKKVLLGAVVGALLVVFYNHVSSERAKRDPAAQAGGMRGGPPAAAGRAGPGGAPGTAGGAGGGASQMAVAVVAVPARSEKIAFEIEALGTARANE